MAEITNPHDRFFKEVLAQPETAPDNDDWQMLPLGPASESHYTLLLTAAAPGTIPAHLWRTSHVIYL